MMRAVPAARLAERLRGVSKFNVETSARMQDGSVVSLAALFEAIEGFKRDARVRFYSVSQASVEQVFLRLAREAGDHV